MTKWGALAGMVVGAVTVLIWANITILQETLYEMIPGFLLSTIAVILVSLVTEKPSKEIEEQYHQMEDVMKK